MGFSLSEYWDILTKFSNPFSIAVSCLKFSGIAFLFFLLLVIFLRKFILVKRQFLFFRILAWTYIILIPLLAAFFGFKWGLVEGVRNDLKTHMHTYTTEMDAYMTSAIGTGANEFVREITTGKDSANLNLTTDEALDRFSDLVYRKFGNVIENEMASTGGVKGKIVAVFFTITKSASISYGLKNGIRELLHDKLGIDEGTSKELMGKKLNDIISTGLFTSIMQVQTDRYFFRLEKDIYILFGMILLFPVMETMVANIIYRRKMRGGTAV